MTLYHLLSKVISCYVIADVSKLTEALNLDKTSQKDTISTDHRNANHTLMYKTFSLKKH